MPSVGKNKGFSLMELIVYTGIAAVILTAVLRFSWGVTGIAARADAAGVLSHSARLAFFRISEKIRGADSVNVEDAGRYADNDQADFGAGTYNETEWSAAGGAVQLSAGGKTAGTGEFTSRVFDAGVPISWGPLNWIPRMPYKKPLVGNRAVESGYSAGNIDMTDNVLLYHLDETTGDIADSSGSYPPAARKTGGNPVYGVAGKTGTAIRFSGGSTFRLDGFDPPHQGTISLWIKPSSVYGKKRIMGTGDNFELILNGGWVGNHLFAAGEDVLASTIRLNTGQWYHLAVTWDYAATHDLKIYINGVLNAVSGTDANDHPGDNLTLEIGNSIWQPSEYFAGDMDEIALFARVLSDSEVGALYKRGMLDMRYQVRSCDDPACSGESFIGPDGTAGTYYSEYQNQGVGLPRQTLTGVPANRYFQYKTGLRTDSPSLTPELLSVSLGYGSVFGADPGLLILNYPGDGTDVIIDTRQTTVEIGERPFVIRKLQMREGDSDPVDLTGNRVNVTGVTFFNNAGAGETGNVTVRLGLQSAGPDDSDVSRDLLFETSVSLRKSP